nr:MAG TPA: hypothetical protein [Bacteriophage sp.]
MSFSQKSDTLKFPHLEQFIVTSTKFSKPSNYTFSSPALLIIDKLVNALEKCTVLSLEPCGKVTVAIFVPVKYTSSNFGVLSEPKSIVVNELTPVKSSFFNTGVSNAKVGGIKLVVPLADISSNLFADRL